MSKLSADLDPALESLMGRVIEEFQQRVRAGEQPDVADYARLHPPIAGVLRQLLPAVRLLQKPAGASGAFCPQAPPLPGPAALPSDPEGYEILREVGRGGMGVVYEARDRRLNRVVALKMVLAKSHARPEDLVRFLAEAEAVAQLQHPNIVQVFETGQHREQPYFTMELVAGGSLSARLDGAPLPPAQVAPLLEPLARAVHYAHQMGIVHRDLKPANVLLAACGLASESAKPQAALIPKVTDFGLAKRVEGGASLTQAGVILGTPSYMAPEQARGRAADVGPHSDSWALGAILYECLTGRPPFQGPTPTDTMLQVTHAEPVPPRRLQPGVPRDLETICLKCLNKEPSQRYVTAEALADDLRRFQAGKPIHARPLGLPGRGWRWCRRNPVVAGLAALTALVFLVSFVLVAALWRRAEHNFAAAEAQRRRADDERDRAEEEKQIAEAVGRFLQIDLLRQADPFEQAEAARLAGGRFEAQENPTVRELLDRAAAGLTADRIEAKFPKQPRVQAEILRTIGSAYLGVGEHEKAITHLARARDRMTFARGPDHPDTLVILRTLAMAYRAAGRTAAAIPLLQDVRDAFVARLGPDHPHTIATLAMLATAYLVAGRKAEAVALREAVYRAWAARLGPDDASTLRAMHNLAEAYRVVGRRQKSIALLEKVRDARLSRLGPQHPATLVTLHSLALSYRAAGRTAEATALLERVRDAKVARFGPDHPRTLNALGHLAVAYRSAGNDESVPLFEKTLELRKAKLGPDHPDTLWTMAKLGVNYRNVGKQAEAVALLEEALERARKLPGPMPPRLEWVVGALAAAYDGGGQFTLAEPLHRESVELARKRYPASHPCVAYAMTRLGRSLLKQRKWSEAESILRQCLAAREKNAPGSWREFGTKALLGAALLGQKKYADAEPLLRAGYEGMKALADGVSAEGRPWLREALGWLIELAEAQGENDAAARWRKELGPDGRG
jgi:tetratricopeptide (TPR) repeat protein/tRNA A-37 threonylcarbamoyl transferase component Bud32